MTTLCMDQKSLQYLEHLAIQAHRAATEAPARRDMLEDLIEVLWVLQEVPGEAWDCLKTLVEADLGTIAAYAKAGPDTPELAQWVLAMDLYNALSD